ncbi:unnamed protein product [Musa textilis]
MTTVELLVNMHCEACAEQLKTKLLKMRGVQAAGTDLSAGEVTVTGTMNGEKLVGYIRRRTGKVASIVPQPPKEEQKEEAEKKPEETPAEEKKEEEEEEKKDEVKSSQPQDSAGSNKSGDGKEEKGGGEEQKKEGGGEATAAVVSKADMIKKMIYWNGSFIGEDEMARRMLHWMPVYVIQQQPPPPPPQLCSDENPNASCIS